MLDCFKKDYSKPSKPIESHGDNGSFKPVWGFINPHLERAGGAEHPQRDINEYKYGHLMKNHHDYPFETRDSGGVYGAAKALIKKGCNASIEDHKNAYNNSVNGAEILVIKGDRLSIDYAEMMLDEFNKMFPQVKIRGVKQKNKGDRGYNNLRDSKRAGMDIALLPELFFIDSFWIDPAKLAEFYKKVLN